MMGCTCVRHRAQDETHEPYCPIFLSSMANFYEAGRVMKIESEFKFLMKVKDKVTGFSGILTAKVTYPFDPPKWWVTQLLEDGTSREALVSETRLEIV